MVRVWVVFIGCFCSSVLRIGLMKLLLEVYIVFLL